MERTTDYYRIGIFIMMKYPEEGKVKRRLAESIGEEAATSLYRTFILDTLTTVYSLDIPFHIAVYPPDSMNQFIQWLGDSYRCFSQKGTDLGERLQNSFAMMFERGYQNVIALASDSPDLPSVILQKAVTSLQNNNVVIGPAEDGGYYLIGFSNNGLIPEAFEGISWGTEHVFQETLSRIGSVTKQIYVLEKWPDIDTGTDLEIFYEKYRLRPSVNLETMKYLLRHPEILQSLLF